MNKYIIGKQFGGWVLIEQSEENKDFINNLENIEEHNVRDIYSKQKLLDDISMRNKEIIDKNKAIIKESIDAFDNNQSRIQELQDKAVIEGLTDEEKTEYKELRGL